MNIIVSKEDKEYIEESIKSGEVLREDLARWFKEKWVDVSKKINGKYLNTGKLYRVVAFSIDPSGNITKQAIENSANFLEFLEKFGENIEIFSKENSELTSQIATIPQVRQNLFQFQIDFANSHSPVILEGRDIGTHILPNAEYKFFVTASANERATRRFNQEKANGLNPSFEEILDAITKRDERDSTRKENASLPAKDAIIIDTTELSIQASLNKILHEIQWQI